MKIYQILLLIILSMPMVYASHTYLDDHKVGINLTNSLENILGHNNFSITNGKFDQSLFYRGDGSLLKSTNLRNFSYSTGTNDIAVKLGVNRTIEGWFYFNETTDTFNVGQTRIIFNFLSGTANNINFRIIHEQPAGKHFNMSLVPSGFNSTQSTWVTTSKWNVTRNVWHHFAIVHYNSSVSGTRKAYLKLYVDGVLNLTFANLDGRGDAGGSVRIDQADGIRIGGYTAITTFYGSLDEFRMSNTSRYVQNFVSPSGEFSADVNTRRLYHFDYAPGNVKFLRKPFLNFTSLGLGNNNQFWINATRATEAKTLIKFPNASFKNFSMTSKGNGNFSVILNFNAIGVYNVSRVYATAGIDINQTFLTNNRSWTYTNPGLSFSKFFLNKTAVLRHQTNQFWVSNTDATHMVITIKSPNNSQYNFSMIVKPNNNFSARLTFGTLGFFNVTKLHALLNVSSTRNTTRVPGNLGRWEITNSSLFTICNFANGDRAVALNFSFYDEVNQTRFNATSVKGYILGRDRVNGSSVNQSILFENKPRHFAICIQPRTHTFKVNMSLIYEKDGFAQREYYLRNSILTNTTRNILLYSLINSLATAITFDLNDELDNPLSNYLLDIQKYDLENNSYRTIAMGKTDEQGKDLIYLQQNSPFYRFKVLDLNGGLVFTSEVKKVITSSLTINIIPQTVHGILDNFYNIVHNLTYYPGIRSFNASYQKFSSNVLYVCMDVRWITARNSTLLNSQCSSATIASFGYAHPAYNGTFIASLYANQTGSVPDYLLAQKIISYLTGTKLYDLLNFDGPIFALFLLLVLVGIGIFNPSIALVFGILSIFVAFSMSLINIVPFLIIGTIVAGAVLIGRMKT